METPYFYVLFLFLIIKLFSLQEIRKIKHIFNYTHTSLTRFRSGSLWVRICETLHIYNQEECSFKSLSVAITNSTSQIFIVPLCSKNIDLNLSNSMLDQTTYLCTIFMPVIPPYQHNHDNVAFILYLVYVRVLLNPIWPP